MRLLVVCAGWVAMASSLYVSGGDLTWDALRRQLEADPRDQADPSETSVAGAGNPVRETLRYFACRLGVPAPLAFAVAEQESNWDPKAVSEKGAKGLMQVLPGTADQYGLDRRRLTDQEYGAYAGLVVLRDLLDRFESEPVVLAAYYAGPNFASRRYSRRTQKEIQEYVRRVSLRRAKYGKVSCS